MIEFETNNGRTFAYRTDGKVRNFVGSARRFDGAVCGQKPSYIVKVNGLQTHTTTLPKAKKIIERYAK